MAILVSEDGGERERDYAAIYFARCGCAGPQPSRNNPRLDEHAADCPYRVEVERLTDGGEFG